MTDPDDNTSDFLTTIWRKVAKRHLPLESETAWFILVSAFDFWLTYYLLTTGGFGESNPIARFFIYGWGIKGMLYFKFAMVTFIVLIAQVIATQKPDTARRILSFATIAVAAVVIYSLTLLLRHP